MEDSFESTREVKYEVQYRMENSDGWFVAGDIYGYDSMEEAEEVEAKELAKPAVREFKGPRMVRVAETRILKCTTTVELVRTD